MHNPHRTATQLAARNNKRQLAAILTSHKLTETERLKLAASVAQALAQSPKR